MVIGGSSTSTGNVHWNREAFGGVFALSGHPQKQKETGGAIKERTKGPSSSLDLHIGNDSEDFASLFRLSLNSGNDEEEARGPPSGSARAIMEPTLLSLATPASNPASLQLLPTVYNSHRQSAASSSQPVLSATALLQKAAQIGSSSSSSSSGGSLFRGFGLSLSTGHYLHDHMFASHANTDTSRPVMSSSSPELELALKQPSSSATASPHPMTEPPQEMTFSSSHPQTHDFLGSNNPTTLDFLGVGQDANLAASQSAASSSLLSSTSGATQFGMGSSSSFGGVLGHPWDDNASR